MCQGVRNGSIGQEWVLVLFQFRSQCKPSKYLSFRLIIETLEKDLKFVQNGVQNGVFIFNCEYISRIFLVILCCHEHVFVCLENNRLSMSLPESQTDFQAMKLARCIIILSNGRSSASAVTKKKIRKNSLIEKNNFLPLFHLLKSLLQLVVMIPKITCHKGLRLYGRM